MSTTTHGFKGAETTKAESQMNAPTASDTNQSEKYAGEAHSTAKEAANTTRSQGRAAQNGTTFALEQPLQQAQHAVDTVAAEAQHNVEKAKQSAGSALGAVQGKDVQDKAGSALNQLQEQVKQTTDAAVAEGQRNVEEAKAAGASYVEQGKQLAGNVLSSVQSQSTEVQNKATSALEQLREQAKQITDTAPGEGQRNVENEGKASNVGYLEQAKQLAGGAFTAAQSYLPAGLSGKTESSTPGTKSTGTNVAESIQSTATSAIETTKDYLVTAQATVQPHLDSLKGTIQPHIDSARAAAQPHIERAKEAAQTHMEKVTGAAQPYVEKAKSATQELGATTSEMTANGNGSRIPERRATSTVMREEHQ